MKEIRTFAFYANKFNTSMARGIPININEMLLHIKSIELSPISKQISFECYFSITLRVKNVLLLFRKNRIQLLTVNWEK